MSGGSDISLVDMLIAAYKEGIKIADRIKRKRAQQGAQPPPPELEKALRDGEVRIAEVRDENRDVKADFEAQMALKDLIIEVQGTLLRQLGEAEHDDSFDDFSETIDTAVHTRRRAINELNNLYNRAEAEARRQKKAQATADATARAKQEEDEKMQWLFENERRRQQEEERKKWQAAEEERKQRVFEEEAEKKRRLLEEEEKQRLLEEEKQRLLEQEERERRLLEEQEKQRRLLEEEEEERKRRLLEQEKQRRLLEEEEERKRRLLEDDEKRLRLLRQETELARSLPIPIEQEDSGRRRFWSISFTSNTSELPANTSIGSPALQPSPLSPRLSASPQHYPTSGTRSTWSTTSTAPTSPAVGTPTPIQPLTKSSNVGGFCQGAWYAQNLRLDKATGKPSLRAYGWSFHCKKCNFRLQADMRDRNGPRFDDRIYQTQTTRFRLLFLLKSHLPVKAARDARAYACLLCALMGITKHCHGEDHLIEHVQRHAKETLGDTYLDGPVSVMPDGVHIESNTTFDIVFGNPPPDDEDSGGAQYLDSREVEFSLPPPAEHGGPPPVELDASEPPPNYDTAIRFSSRLLGSDTSSVRGGPS
ncbi:hypothetical protein DV735_g5535, partial [Chaetothyriales sp. CBS 134920]